jgi:hypothetical protein
VEHGAEVHAVDARFCSHIRERAIAVVVIEDVLSVLRHIQVGPAVVVIVTRHAAQAEPAAGHACLIGHIRKRTIPVVAIQSIPPIHEVDVRPAVAIEVGHAHAWPGFLHDVGDTLVALEMDETDPGFFRDVVEDRSGCAARPWGREVLEGKENQNCDERRERGNQRAIREHLVDIIGLPTEKSGSTYEKSRPRSDAAGGSS